MKMRQMMLMVVLMVLVLSTGCGVRRVGDRGTIQVPTTRVHVPAWVSDYPVGVMVKVGDGRYLIHEVVDAGVMGSDQSGECGRAIGEVVERHVCGEVSGCPLSGVRIEKYHTPDILYPEDYPFHCMASYKE